jgi:cation:H+ antiporter
MILEVLLIIVGIAVVLWGADRFTDGATGLARRLKVSELVIGLTVVALGTSLPEFMVSFMSVLRGSSDMSVGNIIGSNVFNILVILGASAIMRTMKVEKSLLRRDIPICLAASSLLFAFAVTEGTIARMEGLVLVAFFCAYLYMAYRVARKDRRGAPTASPDSSKGEEKSLAYFILLILLGMAALVVGGRVLVDNAVLVAKECHVSESVIGATILAGGTSLPELATSIMAARKGSLGLAFGNVIGSNVFNIAFVIGVCSIVRPMAVSDISLTDWFTLIFSNMLLWTLALACRSLTFWKGAVLVAAYMVYLLFILFL